MTDITTRMANPTADWEKVGDKFYRKIQLYTAVFDQDLELENYIVTGCSYGGAIGMLLLSTVGYVLENVTVRETVGFRVAQWKGTELLNLTMACKHSENGFRVDAVQSSNTGKLNFSELDESRMAL